MTAPGKHRRFRITVMLGNTDSDTSTLDTLSLLAAETPAEILGLFMEDSELLSLADLPVVREYCRLTQVERRLNSAELQRQLRIQARSARQALAAIAGRAGFSWSFRTVRGSLANLLQHAAQDMDVMLLGATPRTLPFASQFSSTTRPRPYDRPVSIIFDGSKAAQRALAVASRIARAGVQPLNVFLVAENADDFTSLGAQATESARPVTLCFHEWVNADFSEILAAVRGERTGTLVLDMNEQWISPNAVELLRKHLSCPVVLVK